MNPTQQRFMVFCVFVVLIIVGVGFVVSNALTGKAGEVDLNGKAKNIQAEKGANLEERLGVDDGASLAFIYGADMQGSLDNCGCKANPVGGLVRRVKYVNSFKEKYKDIPVLHVDVGHLFNEELAAEKPETLREDALLMNEWMLKAFSQFKLDAINFSHRDMLYGKVVLDKEKYQQQLMSTPILGDMISANISPSQDINKITPLKPYVIREVQGKRLGKKANLRVGFVGLTETWPNAITGFVVNEPLEKIKAILPEVRAKADLVVVLAYCNLGVAKEIIKQNPDIDVLITANAVALPPPAQRDGKTIFVHSINQTKSLGELRLYLDDEGKVKDYLNRYISLDRNIPDDTEAAKVFAASKVEIEAAKAKILAAEEEELKRLNEANNNLKPNKNAGSTN
ncbi:MAG: hypothetical protein IPK14_20455 [Blastocatellia bacterium]|nr:hypothetical protein [Blastocatellia bacterium]MBL8195995.1 hypothetical protein [Blastocatellia bacterium]MBN8722195.1 hypothetical protein [Acidobacteriota bacterium]